MGGSEEIYASGVRRRDIEGGGAALLFVWTSCTAHPPLTSVCVWEWEGGYVKGNWISLLPVTNTGLLVLLSLCLSLSLTHTLKDLAWDLTLCNAVEVSQWMCVLSIQYICVTVGGALSHARSMLWCLSVWLRLSHSLPPTSWLPPSLSESLHHVGYKELRGAEDWSVPLAWELMQCCAATQQPINQATGKYWGKWVPTTKG